MNNVSRNRRTILAGEYIMAESLRILILEDNPADAELIQFELEEAGLTAVSKVVMAEEDFVRGLQDFSPDLILSDYDLPTYNGALALAEARRRRPDTPFILVTGAVTEDRAIDILTQGAKDYVLKSRLQQRLGPAVRRALAEAEEHRARSQAEAELREAHRNLEEKVKIRTAELETEMAARKKTDEALRESEEQFRTLANSIPNLAWWANGDGYIIWYNQRWYEYTGTTPEQMEGWGWQSAHDPEVLPRVLERWTASIATGQPFDMEFPLRGADGVFHPFLTRVMPVKDSTGKVLRWFGTNTDISALKQAEYALRDSEKRYRRLFEAAKDGVLILDADTGKVVDVNPFLLQLLGYSFDDLYGKHIWELGLFKDIAASKDTFKTLQDNEYVRYDDLPLETRDGQSISVEFISNVYFVDHHRVVQCNIRDITERKQADEEIARLASFPMFNPNPIIEVDFAGVTHFCNPAAERLFPNFRQQELEHPLLADWEAIVRSFCEGGLKESTRELKIHERWYQQTIYFVEEAKRIRIYAHDITVRKEADQELRDRAAQLEIANRELESFSRIRHGIQ
jgi:PAS domain S-box-containing protein